MAFFDLTWETVLDLTVNLIPVGILVGMEVLFFAYNPFGWDLWYTAWMHFLTLFPLVLLLILTYVSGRVIQREEGKTEALPEGDRADEDTRLSLRYWLGD